MKPVVALHALLLIATSGCGLLADAFSDAATTELDVELFPAMTLGKPTMQPVVFSAAASHTQPTYRLPVDLDTPAWGNVVALHNQAKDAGSTEDFFAIQVSDLVIDSNEALRFDVVVGSRDGILGGLTTDGTLSPDSCSFQLEPTAMDGATLLGASLTTCVSDWVRQNGVPSRLDYEVTVSLASLGNAAPGEFSVSHSEGMYANHFCEAENFDRNLQISKSVVDNFEQITLEKLGMVGSGSSSENVFMAGWAVLGSGPRQTRGAAFSGMSGGVNYNYGWEGDALTVNDYDFVGFSPAMPTFIRQTLELAVEEKRAGGDTLFAHGSYVVCGDYPRTGTISVNITGLAKPNTDAK